MRYDVIDGQDVNIVDPARIRAEIAHAIDSSTPTTTASVSAADLPAPNPDTQIDIVNAGSTSGVGADAAQILGKHDFTVDDVRDRQLGEPLDTVISYGPDAETDARSVATLLGIDNAPQSSGALAANHIQWCSERATCHRPRSRIPLLRFRRPRRRSCPMTRHRQRRHPDARSADRCRRHPLCELKG